MNTFTFVHSYDGYSLVLQGPSWSRKVPVACKGSILALWHSIP